MACCDTNCLKNSNYKSSFRAYNSTAQTVTATATALTVNGNICTDTGCSLTPTTTGVNINGKGLYYISADVTITPTAAGTEIVQLYNGTTALPCAIAQATVAAGSVYTLHIETELVLTPCTNIIPAINVKTSGVAGVVNWVGMTVRKDA